MRNLIHVKDTVGLILLALFVLSAPLLVAQPLAQAAAGQVLIEATDGVTNDGFGSAVAISGDLMAIGAPYATINGITNAGAVYLYQRSAQTGGSWELLKKLTREPPSRTGQFGEQLALSGDVLAVGAPHESGSGGFQQGAAYLFTRDQGGPAAWGLARSLSDDSLGALGQYGSSIAVDGDLLAIGAEGAHDHAGAAYLYSRATSWGLLKSLSDPAGHISALFGSSIAIAGDTIIVGAERTNQTTLPQNEGAAFVFQRDQGGSELWGMVARLAPELPQPNAGFGHSVAISADTIVVGEIFRNTTAQGQVVAASIGAAWIFERNQGGLSQWGLTKQLSAQDGAALDYFGGQVAVVGDNIWVAAHGSDAGGFIDQGLVYQYARNQNGTGAWGALPTIEGESGLPSDRFGSALSASDSSIAVGAPGHASGRGLAYVIGAGVTLAQDSFRAYLPLVLHDWYPPTGVLNDGGTLQSADGALLGVVAGTLTSPIEATIMAIPAPANALPAAITPVGSYYVVGGQKQTLLPANKPLLVGLPVPPGVNHNQLAVAALVSSSFNTEAEGSLSTWTTIPGSYDPTNNLFVITLGLLAPGGMPLVLFTDPQNQPLTMLHDPQRSQQATINFQVECDLTRLISACTPANKLLVAQEMEAAYSLFVTTHGFNPPNMVHLLGLFAGAGQQPELVDSYYHVQIATDPCTGSNGDLIAGQYSYQTLMLLICVEDPSSSAAIQKTVRHELFHAIQAAYPLVSADYLSPERARTHWLTEGTATAAERSSFIMLRSADFTLRQATAPLTSTLAEQEYSAQDFWVYTGLELGEPIAYLQTVFAQGATPEHVNNALGLPAAYWSWAKNQTFEHHESMDGAFRSPACSHEILTTGLDRTTFLFYSDQHSAQGVLPPLTSGLVEINFQHPTAGVFVIADNDGDSADLRYKVYEDGEAGCQAVADGPRMLTNLPAGARRYVLVSNVSLSSSFTYVVQVQGG